MGNYDAEGLSESEDSDIPVALGVIQAGYLLFPW